MKFSERWLREWVDPALNTAELAEQLTMAGLKVESVEPLGGHSTGLIVAEILEVKDHPQADRLHVCRVSVGGGEPLQVVCGAPNARAGLKAPFAPIGATIGGERIKQARLRQVESFGMLCSEREVGLSDRHEGLLELPADAPVGRPLADYLQLEDHIIHLDITPNRADCLGIRGIARELGVLNNLDLNHQAMGPVPIARQESFPVGLSNPEACPRYVGRVIRNVDTSAETPLWMKERLRRSELRSIDPIVDVTNYVMLELGQPLHAFDLDCLRGGIDVRLAAEGESITLLDNRQVALNPGTLLITDDAGPIAIAGIMGGKRTAVTPSSTSIFLESAFFAPLAMIGKARSYGMNTDASHRFERGVDFELQHLAIERATRLILDIAGGEAGPVVEACAPDRLPVPGTIELRGRRIKRVLGIEIEPGRVDAMFARLGFRFERRQVDGDDHWRVQPPSHRFDMALEADLIEEISRVYGYNQLPTTLPKAPLAMGRPPEAKVTLQHLRRALVHRGYQEVITYSFVDPQAQTLLDPGCEPIALTNPISADLAVMRTRLWPGLMRTLIHNRNRQQDRIRLFEVGLRFRQPANQSRVELKDIRQEKVLSGVATGARYPESWARAAESLDFHDLKGDLETVLELGLDPGRFTIEAGSHPALHPGQTASILLDGVSIGELGLLHPSIQSSLDLATPVYLFEVLLEPVLTGRVPVFREFSRFPEMRRDLAILVHRETPAAQIEREIRRSAGEHLHDLKLFDVYVGKGIDPARKSLALGLTFRHPSRNLTDQEINDAMSNVVASLQTTCGASLRN